MPFNTAVLVLSDSRAAGDREDLVIPACRELLGETVFKIVDAKVVSDDKDVIVATLQDYVNDDNISLVLTSGGTGLAPRDHTPEATREVIEREAPGLMELVRLRGLDYTAKAMLTRGVAGAAGHGVFDG